MVLKSHIGKTVLRSVYQNLYKFENNNKTVIDERKRHSYTFVSLS